MAQLESSNGVPGDLESQEGQSSPETQGKRLHLLLAICTYIVNPLDGEAELSSQPNSIASNTSSLRKRTSQLFKVIQFGSNRNIDRITSPNVESLVQAYNSSAIAGSVKTEISEEIRAGEDLTNAGTTVRTLCGHQRASWVTQFRILSGRAFKNMYRDPALLTAHYAASVVVAGKFFLPFA
jgi:hypothetical protein